MELIVDHLPHVIFEGILSNRQDIPFPPVVHVHSTCWHDNAFRYNYPAFLTYLHKNKGYSQDYLLINRNYYEYTCFGLEGFEIICAIIHFLEKNPFMSRELNQINYSLPI